LVDGGDTGSRFDGGSEVGQGGRGGGVKGWRADVNRSSQRVKRADVRKEREVPVWERTKICILTGLKEGIDGKKGGWSEEGTITNLNRMEKERFERPLKEVHTTPKFAVALTWRTPIKIRREWVQAPSLEASMDIRDGVPTTVLWVCDLRGRCEEAMM